MPQAVNIAVSILHIILAVVMIVFILLQSSKRTGLSGSIGGGSETFFGKNQVKTMDGILSRLTGICAVAFLITSLFLAYSFTLNKNSATPIENQPPVAVQTENPDAANQATTAQPKPAQ